jgi:lysophospholipase L1-like esterase
VSAGGTAVRIRLSNFFSDEPLAFAAASIGMRTGGAVAALAPPIPLTVGGSATFSVPLDAIVYTDPVNLAVSAGDELLVSTYALGELPMLSHDWANRAQYATAECSGDRTAVADGGGFAVVSAQVCWIDAVDVLGTEVDGAVVALGDSITDGAGTPLDTHTRWTDYLATRLGALGPDDPRRRSVYNAGIGGGTLNSLGNPQVGVNGLTRFAWDVLGHAGVTDVIVFLGTNDVYLGSPSHDVIRALRQARRWVHDAGKRAFVATLIPRGNGLAWNQTLEVQRVAVNAWIRAQTEFDAVIDMDGAVQDPEHPSEILAAYDADGTHPNAAGGEAMANAIDLDIFGTSPRAGRS